jgi:outer membrane receptor protein involved in Fe transport
VSATLFENRLDDAVANVTLARTPALISRQRQNLDRVRVRGAEVGAEVRLSPAWTMRFDWLANDARVRRASAQPALEGLRLAQVPRHTWTAGLDWSGPAGWKITVRVRHLDLQFEDDENQLPLAAVTTCDFEIGKRWNRWQVFAAVENAFDAAVETGRSNENLVNYGTPRLARSGVRLKW